MATRKRRDARTTESARKTEASEHVPALGTHTFSVAQAPHSVLSARRDQFLAAANQHVGLRVIVESPPASEDGTVCGPCPALRALAGDHELQAGTTFTAGWMAAERNGRSHPHRGLPPCYRENGKRVLNPESRWPKPWGFFVADNPEPEHGSIHYLGTREATKRFDTLAVLTFGELRSIGLPRRAGEVLDRVCRMIEAPSDRADAIRWVLFMAALTWAGLGPRGIAAERRTWYRGGTLTWNHGEQPPELETSLAFFGLEGQPLPTSWRHLCCEIKPDPFQASAETLGWLMEEIARGPSAEERSAVISAVEALIEANATLSEPSPSGREQRLVAMSQERWARHRTWRDELREQAEMVELDDAAHVLPSQRLLRALLGVERLLSFHNLVDAKGVLDAVLREVMWTVRNATDAELKTFTPEMQRPTDPIMFVATYRPMPKEMLVRLRQLISGACPGVAKSDGSTALYAPVLPPPRGQAPSPDPWLDDSKTANQRILAYIAHLAQHGARVRPACKDLACKLGIPQPTIRNTPAWKAWPKADLPGGGLADQHRLDRGSDHGRAQRERIEREDGEDDRD